MKFFKLFIFSISVMLLCGKLKAQEDLISSKNDSILLAQAYMNLYLTASYFDSLEWPRIEKILNYEKSEIDKIKTPAFLRGNQTLYQFTQSLLQFNQTYFFYSDRRTQAILSRPNPQRKAFVIRLKNSLDIAIKQYNNSGTNDSLFYSQPPNSFFNLIGFTIDADLQHKTNLIRLKNEINDKIDEELYQDFRRFLTKAKFSKIYELDSMQFLSRSYGIPIKSIVQTNQIQPSIHVSSDLNNINPEYYTGLRAEVIYRYVELMTLLKVKSSRESDHDLLNSKYKYWINRLNSVDDDFIKEELNPTVVAEIKKQVDNTTKKTNTMKSSGGGITGSGRRPTSIKKPEYEEAVKFDPPLTQEEPIVMYSQEIQKKFFPSPPPKASAKYFVSNYKSELSNLGQVDTFLKGKLASKGFTNQLHYYYFNQNGFAIATSLEKFNLDGSEVPNDKRFIKSLGSEDHFSYFEIVKSMFLDIESEYRMFTFIIDSNEADPAGEGLSGTFSEQILLNSYKELPADLKEKVISPKVLTVLVYHFHQNDIGEVPELVLGGNINVQDYLQKAGLASIIQ
ncbi:hypothetical protein FHS59_000701 [Algoriphagus iocasae]|uniref:Uncharacterized protein n=1 Tax=Algoriphagus iocasae TaxID=1836499 RepID=A0A841MLG4_9BACT|nr:hypothetical protein [Algoriphagus iocasae]MBB6325086.1 hypothetical protein [Algoriphagus iocasae]